MKSINLIAKIHFFKKGELYLQQEDSRPAILFKLTTNAVNFGLDFGGGYIPAVKKIQLIPDASHQTNRVVDRGLQIYYSANTTYYTLVPRTEWTYSKGSDGVITIVLKNPIKARYLKIHSLYNDTEDGNSVNKATFLNELSSMLRVYEELEETKKEEYQYDSSGNRKECTVTLINTTTNRSYYYPNSDRLLTDQKYGYVYDEAGNLIKKGNRFDVVNDRVEFTLTKGNDVEYWEYVYDLMNRLVEVRKNDSKVVKYGYDPEGKRVMKKLTVGETTLKPPTIFLKERNLSMKNN